MTINPSGAQASLFGDGARVCRRRPNRVRCLRLPCDGLAGLQMDLGKGGDRRENQDRKTLKAVQTTTPLQFFPTVDEEEDFISIAFWRLPVTHPIRLLRPRPLLS
ncbi:hypothetical protein RIB2604_02300370 [Aspergillus luchuensis]|uniref:Uncharacterized protein n=1 Tax=Aspergillus kawachii TaxID=1069201 RepID=A0A146FRS8_ASPKA|nr:hypothetical protein RIB2604_02300370 [Aspergillus luchuensis]